MKPLVCGINAGISGYYTFHKKMPNGNLVPLLDGAKSKNLIVDQWLNAFKSFVNSTTTPRNSVLTSSSTTYQIMRRVVVGTGTSVPAVSNTGLQNQVASKTEDADTTVVNTFSYSSETDNFTFTHSKTFTFPLGGVVGNISEVGIFSNSSTSNTFNTFVSRALLLDNLGNPTTLTLTSEDQLVVTYTMVLIVPRTVSFNFSYLDIDYNLEGKLNTGNPGTDTGFSRLLTCLISTFEQARTTDIAYPSPTQGNGFGGISAGWTALNGAATTQQMPPLNPASVRKQRIRFPLLSANFAGGIKVFTNSINSPSGNWVFKFTPNFPKTANEILEIEFATDFVRL